MKDLDEKSSQGSEPVTLVEGTEADFETFFCFRTKTCWTDLFS